MCRAYQIFKFWFRFFAIFAIVKNNFCTSTKNINIWLRGRSPYTLWVAKPDRKCSQNHLLLFSKQTFHSLRAKKAIFHQLLWISQVIWPLPPSGHSTTCSPPPPSPPPTPPLNSTTNNEQKAVTFCSQLKHYMYFI